MYLYEITDGSMSMSYVRVYVIANTDEEAHALAQTRLDKPTAISAKVAVALGFCSESSGDGLVLNGREEEDEEDEEP